MGSPGPGPKACCVQSCSLSREDNVILHQFPNPAKEPARFNAWIDAVGGNLLDLEDMYVFKYRRICHTHFEAKYRTRSKMMSNIAIPTLQMKDLTSIFAQENMDVSDELDTTLDISLETAEASSHSDATTNTPVQRKPFEDLSNKQKRRRLSSLRDHSEEELMSAVVNKLKENENIHLAEVIECLYKDDDKTKNIHSYMFKKLPKSQRSIPQDEALALVTATKLSKWQYLTFRKSLLKEDEITPLPSYQKVIEAKKSCYPEDISISETGVRIKLQSILDLTVKKIFKKNINIQNFKKYCLETAELYVELYPWYYMPSSIHKLLIHGADICQHFSFIPVGMLSEEASEARNKDFRNIRERHSRKIGRKETNTDIIHQFLISSDPYITSIRPKLVTRNKLEHFPDVDDLIINDEQNLQDEISEYEDVFINVESNVADPLE